MYYFTINHLKVNAVIPCISHKIAPLALDQIGREYKRMGHCEFSVLKERFMQFQASIALSKNSPYTETISKEYVHK